MSENDHPRGTCGMFCPYCRVGVLRNLEAVRKYEQTFDDENDIREGKMSKCIIEVGHPKETPATWVDSHNPDLTVCDHHKYQRRYRIDTC